MSHTDMSRRGLLKTSFLGAAGAAAAGATGFGLSSQAQAKQAANAQTYDAVVLGAGPAGLIAAITAHDAGAKVVVLEKRDRPDGNAIFALGSICGWGTRHQAEQGIKDTADDLYAVKGVKVATPEGFRTFMAKGGVCIATGGFSANPEMVDRYIGGWATRMVLRGSKSTTGENISLCMPLYTKFVNMDQFHSGPIIGATHVNPADVLNSGYGVQFNTSGVRFMDENNTYVIKARTTGQMTLDNMAWVIVDSTCPVLDKVIPKFDRLNSPYGKADTIEELCRQVKLPVEKVVKTIKEYNEAVKSGKLGEMNPPCTYKKPHEVAKAPFYAVPFQGGMTATFGGPLINVKAEIQNLDGTSIPGLYAVGNSAGGIFFHNYAGGAQLGAATVFGRIAGNEIAARAKAQKN